MPITVDFFKVRIESEDDDVRFEALLAVINRLSRQARNHKVYDDVLRLHVLHESNNSRDGDMTRIRLGDLPSRGTLEGDVRSLDLDDDEGLAEQAAFLYTPSTQILLLQRNRHCLTPGSFARYVEEKGGSDATIFLDPVLREDAARRLAEFRDVRKFDIRFASINNARAFAEEGRSTKELVEILDYFEAPNANITLSMGRSKGTLLVSRVKEAASALLGIAQQRRSQVRRVEITGHDEDGESDTIDLVKYKMFETIDTTTRSRSLNYATRRNALRAAYENRKDELRRMFV